MSLSIFGVLLFLSWAIPLHILPWVSWHNEVLSFAAAICMTGILLKRLYGGGANNAVKVPILAWPFLILAGIVVFQTAFGAITFFGDALVLIFYLAICVKMLAVGYEIGAAQLRNQPSGANFMGAIGQFAWLLVIGGLFSTVIALAQVLDVWDTSSWVLRMPVLRRPGANIGQPNQLATLIMFAIASLVYLFETGRFSPSTAVFLMGMLLFGLVVTESRTGAISLFLVAIWWMFKRHQLSFRLSSPAVSIGLALFGVCLLLWPILLGMIELISVDTATETMALNLRAGTRLVVWPQLWQAVLQRP